MRFAETIVKAEERPLEHWVSSSDDLGCFEKWKSIGKNRRKKY
jgi:hypothetical protein